VNIHLVQDEKFINKSIERFETYYPNSNIFFVYVNRLFDGKFKYCKSSNNVIPIKFNYYNCFNIILNQTKDNDNIFIHSLNSVRANHVMRLKKNKDVKLFWIFYGADLYGRLNKSRKYELFDYPILVKSSFSLKFRSFISKKILGFLNNSEDDFIKSFDYFCFWNYNDYLLLKKHYKIRAKFKFFRYYDAPIGLEKEFNFTNKKGYLMVNQSASKNGNHITILKRLDTLKLGQNIKQIFVPLSYGVDFVKNSVLEYGSMRFGEKFHPIINYIDKKKYFELLNHIDVAIFGQRRQEGGNNIFYLLSIGAKVFLRRDNNMLKYLKDKGYFVFEFENDLNSVNDIYNFTFEEKKMNRKLVLAEFSQYKIDQTYKRLLNFES